MPMRRRRSSRLRTALGDAAEAREEPTPQTVEKLRRDVIAGLFARRRILPHHAAAAEEIRGVHEAVGRGMFPTAQVVAGTGSGPGRRRARDFLDRMSEHERDLWQRRYLPWTRALAVEIAAGLPGTRWLQLVIDIVVDNATLREVESRYRLRHGTARAYLVRGLELYGAARDA